MIYLGLMSAEHLISLEYPIICEDVYIYMIKYLDPEVQLKMRCLDKLSNAIFVSDLQTEYKKFYSEHPDLALNFVNACSHGYIVLAEWIYKVMYTRNPEADQSIQYNYKMFDYVSNSIEWTVDDLTSIAGKIVLYLKNKIADFEYAKNKAFVSACQSGQIIAAKWLYVTFPQVSGDIIIEAYEKACYHNKLDVIIWLLDKYIRNNITDAKINDIIIRCCKVGQYTVAVYTEKTFRQRVYQNTKEHLISERFCYDKEYNDNVMNILTGIYLKHR